MTEQAMSSKDKRVMEAHRLRYMEDLGNQEIADRLGVSHNTVRHYFSDSDNDKFKRFYSDKQLFELQQSLEQDIWDGEQEAKKLLSDASDMVDRPKEMRQLADQVMKMRRQKVKLLQELGIIQKPKDRVEKTEKSGEVTFNEEIVTEREELVEEAEKDA